MRIFGEVLTCLSFKIRREILLLMGIDPKRSLKNRFPAIAKEWHPTRNKDVSPLDITYGSKKMYW